MSMAPIVRLCHNPWPRIVPDGVLLQYLQTAAVNAQEQMREWEAAGEMEEGRDSFAAVLLDPTRRRWARTISDRVMAIILIGPNAEKYVPNGASKADGHDRHNRNMGELVEDLNHLLADGEFGWGNSAEYLGAIGGGSGLKVKQDGELVEGMLIEVIDSVNSNRRTWLDEQRRLKGNHRWFDPDDEPGAEYTAVLDLPYVTPVAV